MESRTPVPLFTSSFELQVDGWAALRRLARHLLLAGLVFLLIGELWFRLPWTTKLVLWEFDDELVSRLAASQSRGLGLGNFSALSPPMGINRDGFRNGEIDWTQPTILAVGSSELLGPGVEDNEVWTAIASKRLSRATGRRITVVNAGSGGYGPYHHAVQVRRFLEKHPPPLLVIVRVSVGDRFFVRPQAAELDAARNRNTLSIQIKRYSEFLPFLVNKIRAQIVAIQQTFAEIRGIKPAAGAHEAPAVADAMWQVNSDFWRDIAVRATSSDVPVLFFVDGADGAESAERLTELLAREFRGRGDVSVVLFGPRNIGLSAQDDTERRRKYREQFTLGYDPHANVRLHRLEAEFLTALLMDRRPWTRPSFVPHPIGLNRTPNSDAALTAT
jgi:hypothetical protein